MKTKSLITISLIALLGACSSPQKSSLESSDPEMAVKEVIELEKTLRDSQVDITAHGPFNEGREDLREARELIKNGEEPGEALDLLAQAKAHYENAQEKAGSLPQSYTQILRTRKNALNANPFANETNTEMLRDIDDDLISASNSFKKSLEADKNSEFQKRYQELEVKSVQHRELEQFRNIISEAQDKDAKDLAPNTLKKAKVDLLTAENSIAQNARTPQNYEREVMVANKSAKLLQDVMDKLTGSAKGSPENVGLELVYQERKLGKLSETVGNLEENLVQTSSALGDQYLKRVNAESQVRFQRALDEMRTAFNEDEAEAYQQGDKLIFRLKKLDFAPGSSEIPERSTSLLSKIESIISEIDPKDIQIQGHTDSTGSNSWNQKLSLMRAKAVEEYLTSKNNSINTQTTGYGEQKPIATNETKEGRSQNRRVDIVIDVK